MRFSKALKAQKKAIKPTGDTKSIELAINNAETEELDLKKQKKEREKQELINEARQVIMRTYGTLRRLNIISTKWDMSELFNRSKSYFLVLESRNSQPIAYEDIKALKENIQEIKYNLSYFLEETDEAYKEWVARKLDTVLADIEKIELKTLGVLYDIRY